MSTTDFFYDIKYIDLRPMSLLDLDALGWEDRFASAFVRYTGPYIAGRIACRQRTVVEVFTARGPVTASISGSLRKLGRMAVVGDFVVLLDRPEAGTAMVVDILPRKTTFVCGVSGSGTEQVIAANIDTVFIVTAAGRDLDPHRIERYLALVHASGARPVIAINKSDLAPDPTALADSIGPAAAGTPVVAISALARSGLNGLDPYLQPGRTVALI
jgi:ribosome biogenesis GTPase